MLGYVAYFAPLIWALIGCFRSATSVTRVLVAAASIATTWFYILRYTLNYDGEHLFRDSYVEVSEPFYWGVTSQLLSWAVVAMAWSHETASPKYQIMGVFGAMSAARWNPAERRRPTCDRMPLHTSSHLSGLFCVYQLKDAANIQENSATSFEIWLTALHALLLAPKVVGWFEWTQSRRIPSTVAYALLFAGVLMIKADADASANINSMVQFGYAAPKTDCQISIGLDLVFAALLTAFTIVDYYEPTKSLEAALIVFAFLAAMPYATPAGVLVAHMALRHYGDHGAAVEIFSDLLRGYYQTRNQKRRMTAKDGSISAAGKAPPNLSLRAGSLPKCSRALWAWKLETAFFPLDADRAKSWTYTKGNSTARACWELKSTLLPFAALCPPQMYGWCGYRSAKVPRDAHGLAALRRHSQHHVQGKRRL